MLFVDFNGTLFFSFIAAIIMEQDNVESINYKLY